MTRVDMSDLMDTLLDSYRTVNSFGNYSEVDIQLDEYEKSQLLTQAQEDVVQALYAGETFEGESYEETERLRRFISDLNCEEQIEPTDDYDYRGISSDSKFFELPFGLWFITYEAVRVSSDDTCYDGKDIEVIPVRQDWYHRQGRNPFRGTSKRRALRLDKANNVVEIVYPLDIEYYYVRYVRKPTPIILEDLPDGLTIEDMSEASDCTLNSALHTKIVQRAVNIALQRRGIPSQPRQNG